MNHAGEQWAVSRDFRFGDRDGDELRLDCGRVLRDVVIRYETYGTPDADFGNAVLVLHALTGDAHVSGRHGPEEKKPGWWDEMVGPGRPVDTRKYFVICSNVIGGCSGSTGPSSVNPETGRRYNLDFPVITISDMVRAQKRLIDHLGIRKLLAVLGGSMGGMQALEWAIQYPDSVRSAIPIATTSQLSSQSIAFDWVGREAIKYDPVWNNGEYTEQPERGLATARMLAHITYLSDRSMNRKFGRDLQESGDYKYDFDRNFAVESYLEHQGRRFVERFDANSYFYITRAMDYFDPAGRVGGSLEKAFAGIRSEFLVVSFSSDWLFTTAESRRIVRALLANRCRVSFCEIASDYGHDAFLLETERLGGMVKSFLDNQYAAALKERCPNG